VFIVFKCNKDKNKAKLLINGRFAKKCKDYVKGMKAYDCDDPVNLNWALLAPGYNYPTY
jgi:hypothetical protein